MGNAKSEESKKIMDEKLSNVDDRKLLELCLSDETVSEHCSDDSFWKKRFIENFGDPGPEPDSWRNHYLSYLIDTDYQKFNEEMKSIYTEENFFLDSLSKCYELMKKNMENPDLDPRERNKNAQILIRWVRYLWNLKEKSSSNKELEKMLKKEDEKCQKHLVKNLEQYINKADEDFNLFRNKMKSFYRSNTRIVTDNKMIPFYDSIIASLSECETLMKINAMKTENTQILTKWIARLNEISKSTDDEGNLYKLLKHEADRCQKHLEGSHGEILRNLPSSIV